nr:AHH domain-containing protein [Treponema sp.]
MFEKKLLQGGAVLDSGENMHFIVSRVKAIKSKSEESESHGWVKLEFYDNKGEGETDWLPILSETASNGCGFWSLPETGVQALACIFDGTKSGFVIGFLYDEKHKPPVKENEKACDRTILQTKNHRFELVDEEGKETISISTSKGKMRVVLASDGGIEIANKMKKGKIEIEAEELEIESENLIFDEYSTSIEAGVLEITNSNSVSLNTKKDFKVKGKNVKLNGSTGVTAKGRQIAKQDDKVIGVDTHILMVPSPSGAVPTPFSHPFVGALKEDLAASVKIWNNKVATKNSVAKHLAGHVPTGPGPFQKTPDNKGKVTGGTEKSVKANGKEVAVIGSSVTTCNDIGMRDNSKVIAAGMAINIPAIADPMKSEAYERERKQAEEKKGEKQENTQSTSDNASASAEQTTAVNDEVEQNNKLEQKTSDVKNDETSAESQPSFTTPDLTDEKLEEAKKYALCDYGSCSKEKQKKCPYMKSKTICEGEFIGNGSKLQKNMMSNSSAYEKGSKNIKERTSLQNIPFTVQHHHLISSNQCYTQIPELVKLGNFYGYNINNEVNGICAPSGGGYSENMPLDDKIKHSFDAMNKTNVQWHVGMHSMDSVKGKLEKTSKKVNNALLSNISSSLQSYDASVKKLLQTDLLDKLQTDFEESCRCDDTEQEKADFINKMNAISKEVYAKIANYNKNTADTRQWFYISKMAFYYAFEETLKSYKNIIF